MISVEHCNTVNSRYPVTVEDKGWVYGVWYCGTAWAKVRLHGQYPPTFLRRALSLFPEVRDERILHCPSGSLVDVPGVTVDLMCDEVRRPQIQASAGSLPFADNSFDLYISDPPYTPEDSRKYGCAPFPLAKAMREARRVLSPGGHFCVLHTYYPSYRRKEWKRNGNCVR